MIALASPDPLFCKFIAGMDIESNVIYNDEYATAMARLKYGIAPDVLPPADNLDAQSRYWGKYYQTKSDSVKMAKYRSDWNMWVYDTSFGF